MIYCRMQSRRIWHELEEEGRLKESSTGRMGLPVETSIFPGAGRHRCHVLGDFAILAVLLSRNHAKP